MTSVSNWKTTSNYAVLSTLLMNDKLPKFRIEFVSSLLRSVNLSDKQAFWVNKIIAEATGTANTTANVAGTSLSTPVVEINIQNILTMFATAQKKLKFPKVTLQTANGVTVRFAVMGKNSRYAGSLSMGAGAFGSIWYGSIGKDNKPYFTRDGAAIKDDLVALVTKFNADPIKTATEYGKLTNSCCFCHKPLSTDESLGAGFGPVCAERYGLSWGNHKAAPVDILKLPKNEPKFGSLDMDLVNEVCDTYTEDGFVIA